MTAITKRNNKSQFFDKKMFSYSVAAVYGIS